jgi:DNA-binding response OmpR family regulator
VFSYSSRLLISVAVLGALTSLASAQDKRRPVKKAEDDYRQFFKKPQTAVEYWAAMKYEADVGKYDLAADFLKGFLAQKPTDDDLLEIEQEEGMAAFLRLLLIPELKDNAKPLVKRVSAALEKRLQDPDRIRKYVKNLSATQEERLFAIAELRRSGAVAVPYLIDALRSAEDLGEHATILSAMGRLNATAVPPLLAFLDVDPALKSEPADIPTLRVEVMQLLRQWGEKGMVPYLWYLSASPRQPETVRREATASLSALLDRAPDRLAPAKVALVAQAERYYQHKEAFRDPRGVKIWQWTGKDFVARPAVVSASQAEEYYGIRFAQQALDLDRIYQPAQVVLLSLALEKGYERTGLDQPLSKGAPRVKELLKIVNPGLVTAVLERALTDHRLAVILGAVQALGDLAEVRAAHGDGQRVPALVKALNYPDRRVQMAAADALLRIPGTPAASVESEGARVTRGSALPRVPAMRAALAGPRVVEVLRRALLAEPAAKALVADENDDRGHEVARALRKAGFVAVVVGTGREAMSELQRASDIDVILVNYAIPYPQLPYLLSQLRADINVGLLPVLVTTPPGEVSPERQLRLGRVVERYRNVWLMPETVNPTTLKSTLRAHIAEASGLPLSDAERKENARLAINWLRRMAVGEVPGYDIKPAADAILEALRSPDLAAEGAVEAAGRLPGGTAQRSLADTVLEGQVPELRRAAAVELTRHIQQNGLALSAAQIKGLEDLFNTTRDEKLKSNLARVLGALRPSAGETGARLQRYTPPPLPRPPPPPRER